MCLMKTDYDNSILKGRQNEKRYLAIAISILVICFLVLIIFLKQTRFHIRSGTFLNTEIDEKYETAVDSYYGYEILIEGPINPKINSIKIIKRDGTTVNDPDRLLLFLTKGKKERIGSMGTGEVNKRLDEFILPKDFLPYKKEMNLVIRFNSGLGLRQIGGLKTNYSFFRNKSRKISSFK